MIELIRESTFGQLARLMFNNKVFLYPDEREGFQFPEQYFEYAQKPQKEQPQSPRVDEDGFPTMAGLQLSHRPSVLAREAEGMPMPPTQDSDKTLVDKKPHVIIGWYGADDADCPRNYSTFAKCFISFLVSLLTFSVYIGSSIYVPSIPGVAEHFSVSIVAATLGLSLFVVGYATGPILFSPLSEIPLIGRTVIYLVTLLIFVLLQIPTLVTNDFGTLLAMRLLTGFFGSPALAMGGASNADIWSELILPYAVTLWDLGAVLGPIIGPTIAGFSAQEMNWRWPLLELLWISGFTLIVIFFCLPETSEDTLLLRRARRLRKRFNRDDLFSQSEIEMQGVSFKSLLYEALTRPFIMIVDPIIAFLDFYMSIVYAVFYLWFEAIPLTFEGLHHFNLGQTGLAFLGLATGMFFTFAGYILWFKYIERPKLKRRSVFKPEFTLKAGFFGSFFIPVSLFIYGWTSRSDVHWIVPIIGSAFYAPGIELLFISAITYLSTVYPKYAASVLAGNGFLRGITAAAWPLFARAMYDSMGIGGGCSMLAGVSILMIPGMFILYRYGPRLRAASKWAGQQ